MNNDPMMAIFMEECMDLTTQYETYLSMAAEKGQYDLNLINEIFRITHTLKADATMMLYECVAVPMRAFERLLYFYRDENQDGVNYDSFSQMLSAVVIYVKAEIRRIAENSAAEKDAESITRYINEYRESVVSQMSKERQKMAEEAAESEISEEPMRFYVGGQTEELPAEDSFLDEFENSTAEVATELQKEAAASREPQEHLADLSGNATVSAMTDTYAVFRKNAIEDEDLQELQMLINALSFLEGRAIERIGDKYTSYYDLFSEFHEITAQMSDWLKRVWLIPMSHITPKLEKAVSEMNDRLNKEVRLIVTGDDVNVEKSWMDNLSEALIHMIRNAVDHGIEEESVRIAAGKPSYGTVKVEYRIDEENRLFEMSVEDDGSGADLERLREAEVGRGLLEETETPSAEKILQLMFEPGLTTNEKESAYSGRGVGMDAIRFDISELGGQIRVESEAEKGMKLLITIPYRNITAQEEVTDEGFDSRR